MGQQMPGLPQVGWQQSRAHCCQEPFYLTASCSRRIRNHTYFGHHVMARCTFLVHAQESPEGLEADPLADELVLQLSVGILDKGIRHQHAESRKPQIIISEMQTRYLGAHLQKAQQEAVFLLLVVTLQTLENTGQPVLMLEGLQAIPAAAFPGSRWLVLTSRSSSTEALQLLASAN